MIKFSSHFKYKIQHKKPAHFHLNKYITLLLNFIKLLNIDQYLFVLEEGFLSDLGGSNVVLVVLLGFGVGSLEFFIEVSDEVSAVLSEALSSGGSLLLSLGSGVFIISGELGLSGSSLLVEGVQEVHLGLVLKRVSLLSVVELDVLELGSDNGLDFGRVDESSEVSIGEDGSLEDVSLLADSGGGLGAENVVKSLEGGLGPDDESAEVASGGELEEVESVDVASLDSGDVSGGLGDESVLVGVDH